MMGFLAGVVLGILAKILYDRLQAHEPQPAAPVVQERVLAALDETRQLVDELRAEASAATRLAHERATSPAGEGDPAKVASGAAAHAAPISLAPVESAAAPGEPPAAGGKARARRKPARASKPAREAVSRNPKGDASAGSAARTASAEETRAEPGPSLTGR